jgi:ubiquinol-cytochrome c reductase cytochrome c subunit
VEVATGFIARSLPMGLIACAAAFAFWLPNHTPGTAPLETQAVSAPPAAKTTYLRDCSTCHGADARGTPTGPSLQGVGRASVDYWVSTGRMPLLANSRPAKSPQGVPPPGQRLADPEAQARRGIPAYSPAEIAALEDYVSSIAPGGPDVPDVDLAHANLATGGQIFRLQCAACHSWSGVGGALYQRSAPSLRAATATQIAEAVRIGPGQMPAFGTAAVPTNEINDLVAYLRYLDHPRNRGGEPLWYLGPVAEGALAILAGLGALLLCARWIGERG